MMFSDLASIGAGIDAGGRLQDAAPPGAEAAAPIEGAEPGQDFAALLGLFLTAPEPHLPDVAPQAAPAEHVTPQLGAPAPLTTAFEPAGASHAATHDVTVIEPTAPSP